MTDQSNHLLSSRSLLALSRWMYGIRFSHCPAHTQLRRSSTSLNMLMICSLEKWFNGKASRLLLSIFTQKLDQFLEVSTKTFSCASGIQLTFIDASLQQQDSPTCYHPPGCHPHGRLFNPRRLPYNHPQTTGPAPDTFLWAGGGLKKKY